MPPDEKSWPEKQIKSYTDGDDIPTVVGIAKLLRDDGETYIVAEAMADYSEIRDADGYAKGLEEIYQHGDFKRGIKITRVNPGMVQIASVRETLLMALDGKDTGVLQAPSFFIDAPVEPEMYQLFLKKAEEGGVWILHLKTRLASYFYIIRYPAGELVGAHKKDPAEIRTVDNPEDFNAL